MNDDYAGDERRHDLIAAMVSDRIGRVETGLERHITECSKQSRRVFWGVLGVLGWLVLHSQEVSVIAAKVAKGLAP